MAGDAVVTLSLSLSLSRSLCLSACLSLCLSRCLLSLYPPLSLSLAPTFFLSLSDKCRERVTSESEELFQTVNIECDLSRRVSQRGREAERESKRERERERERDKRHTQEFFKTANVSRADG